MKNRILFINLVNSGSTGSICKNIGNIITQYNYESFYIWGIWSNRDLIKNDSNESIFMSSKVKPTNILNKFYLYCIDNTFKKIYFKIYNQFAYKIKGDGFANKCGFHSFKKMMKKIKPDIVHLHNLHGSGFYIPGIIKYCKNNNIPIIYTLHDCWPFTGCCPHFLVSGCDKYLNKKCKHCNFINKYPLQKRDLANKCYIKKYKMFNSYNNITFVGCSTWISNLAKQAPITQNHTVITIQNGIDVNIFKPTFNDNVFKKYNVPFKSNYIISVSSLWYETKGIDDIYKISKQLEKLNINYLVIGDCIDIDKLGRTTFYIKKTRTVNDLAIFYSHAKVMIYPTLEDNLPNVILESVSCNTPVVSYDTGGCKEAINKAGIVVPSGDINKLIEETIKLFHNNSKDKFIYKSFVANEQYKKYLNLYNELIKERKDGKQDIK